MNIRNPLAAALLLIAASASAQPFAPGPVDDIVFKCGTVPYIACTAGHMNKRENIRSTGICPAPASAACAEYLMSTRGASNPAETIAAYSPPPGREWASPDCRRIPCRLADVASDPSPSRPRANPGGSGRTATPPPSDEVASTSSNEARGSGNDAGDFFKSGGGGGAGSSAGGATGGGYAAAAANGKEEAIATQAAELDGVFTYIKTQEIKAAIDKTARAVTSGRDGTFVTPATTPDANAGDLHFKGTQSGANR